MNEINTNGPTAPAQIAAKDLTTVAQTPVRLTSESIKPPVDLPEHSAGAPPLSTRDKLMHYEAIIDDAMVHEDRRAMALLAIYQQKLYKPTHRFFNTYVKQRWGLSRARAYQLLHLARVRTYCLQNGLPLPLNERQARQVGADGTPRSQKPDEDSYELRLGRVTRSLASSLAKSPPADQRRFLQDVRNAVDQFERYLDILSPVHSQPTTYPKTTAGDGAASTGPASPPLSDPTLPSPADHGAEGGRSVQALSPKETVTSRNQGLKPHAHTGVGTARERPKPQGNSGSYLGLTMAEARRLGYVR